MDVAVWAQGWLRLSMFAAACTSMKLSVLRQSSSRGSQWYAYLSLTPTGRLFTADPLVDVHP